LSAVLAPVPVVSGASLYIIRHSRHRRTILYPPAISVCRLRDQQRWSLILIPAPNCVVLKLVGKRMEPLVSPVGYSLIGAGQFD
jgi:hypothetical protein